MSPPLPMAVMTIITSVVTAFFMVIVLGGWPFSRIKNPVAGVIFTVGTALSGLPAPTFLVWVPIPFLFGSIIMLQMLGGSVFTRLKQPVQGLASAITSAVLGLLLALGYSALMPVLSAAFPAGPQGEFQAELWLANALLAMTFPLLAFFGDYFQLWPLAPKQLAEAERYQAAAPAAG